MRPAGARPQALQGIRVIELASEPAAEQLGRLLAEAGADVIKVEPPGGAPGRRLGPWLGDEPGPERSLHFWYYNASKSSVVLDLESTAGRDSFISLVDTADIVVHDVHPADAQAAFVHADLLRQGRPRLIVSALSPFGQTGPWSGYRSSDLVALAAGGPLFECGYDDLTIPPVRPGGNQGYHVGASFAFNAILLALLHRELTGQGQAIDSALHDALAMTTEMSNPYWGYMRTHVRRQTCRHASPVLTQQAIHRCADGRYVYFTLIIAEQKPWEALIEWMESYGLAVDLVGPEYSDPSFRRENFAHIQEVVETFASVVDAPTFFHEAQDRGLPVGILYAPEDLLADRHLRAREFFVPIEHAEATISYPGAPFRLRNGEWRIKGPAPHVGEHNHLVAGLVNPASPLNVS